MLAWKRGSGSEACRYQRNKQRSDEHRPPSDVRDFATSQPNPPSALEHLTEFADTPGVGLWANSRHRGRP